MRFVKRSLFQRILGRPATAGPADSDCWKVDGEVIEIDLARTEELALRGGAIALEGKGLCCRLLIVHGEDGVYHAYRNECAHGGRRMDPVPGENAIQCCSLGKSTFDYDGHVLEGSAKEDVIVYPLVNENGKLKVDLKG